MRFRTISAIVVLASAGCSGGEHSIFGTPNPSGNVLVTMANASTPLNTTPNTPATVPGTGFSVTVHEDNYPAGFDAKVLSYTSGTTVPCWVPSVDQSHQPNLVSFVPANVPIPNNPGFSACPWRGDVEAVRFVDQRGNSAIQYFRTP